MKRRSLCIAVMVTAFSCAASFAADYGRFTLSTDAGNAYLPVSLRCRDFPDVELLHPKLGLNLSFTSFEFRNKFYREENRHVWGERDDARFVVDVNPEVSTPLPVTDGDFTGEVVAYESSYAKIRRHLLFHATEPRFRIVYRIEPTREILVHMADMFGVGLHLGESFKHREILDERQPDGDLLQADGAHFSGRLYNAGPVAFTAPDITLAVLVSTELSDTLPDRMIRLAPGVALTITLNLHVFANDRAGLLAAMRARRREMPAEDAAYRLFATGMDVLYRQNDEVAGEALLNEAARLKPEWYQPHMMIAEYRLQNKIQGLVRGMTMAQYYHEAAFRMPYNYGIILRGGGYLSDERLTDEQQRLLLFNLMAAMENTLFYSEYYLHLAGALESRGFLALANAVQRQALWATEHYPVAQKKRERITEGLRKNIARLEAALLGDITAVPPPPIPIRPLAEE